MKLKKKPSLHVIFLATIFVANIIIIIIIIIVCAWHIYLLLFFRFYSTEICNCKVLQDLKNWNRNVPQLKAFQCDILTKCNYTGLLDEMIPLFFSDSLFSALSSSTVFSSLTLLCKRLLFVSSKSANIMDFYGTPELSYDTFFYYIGWLCHYIE